MREVVGISAGSSISESRTGGNRLNDTSDDRTGLVGLLLCVLCLAYFYMLGDSVIFDYGHFTRIFFDLLFFYDRQTAALAVLVCLAALLWRRPKPILRLVDHLDGHAGAFAFVSAAVFAACALGVYKNYALCMDEYSAVFQSKIFASGHLTAQLPPPLVPWLIAPGFNGSFLLISPETGRAIESYWPGFALLLAPFQVIRLPWLCNAILGGLSIYLIHAITREVTGDRRSAGWAMLFAIASSVFWANAISYYSMQAHLTANLLFAWLLLKPSSARSFAAGLVGSLALILHNPFPHVLFALPWLIALGSNTSTRRSLAPLALGYLPAVAIGFGWALLRAQISPAAQSAVAVAGTLKGVFVPPDMDIFNMRTAALAKMWVWALPCLFYLAVLGYLRTRGDRHVRLLMLSAVSTFVGYLFVKLDQGHGWGYRYFHSAWGVVPILAACALSGRRDEDRLVSFAGAAAVLSLLILVPFQLMQIDGFITRHLAMVPAPKAGGNVYFIDSSRGYYLSDMIQMDPLLRSEDLYLATQGRRPDANLIQRHWPNAVRCGDAPGVVQWCLGAPPGTPALDE
jgi:hypothetical protein